jgi:transmembrane sensor
MNPQVSEERLQQAARWRIRLTELEADSTPEFETWLSEPANALAWAQVSAPWDFLGEEADTPELVAARNSALRHARDSIAWRTAPRRWVVRGAIAAALALVVTGWGVLQWMGTPDEYSTARGERRVITLEDGSRISLDSDSDVTVHYERNARQLQLKRGQARFDVAHDVERPFSVMAGNQKVIATGTAFNIDLTGAKVIVTLIEGHVVVVDEQSGARAMPQPVTPNVELAAGQQLSVQPQKSPDIASVNVQHVTAWVNGQLMFENEPLSEVVARVNRYTSTAIEIRDPRVGAMRVSGVFNTGDVAGVLDIVTHYLPVRAVNSSNGTVMLERSRELH